MMKSILELEYGYYYQDELALLPVLSALEQELGGQRRQWIDRKGATDLATLLEIYVFLKIAAKGALEDTLKDYISGFIGAEGARQLGSRHRAAVVQRLKTLRSDFERIISAVNKRLQEGLVAPGLNGKELPVAIRIEI
jgi:hypothetical protein